MKEKLEKWLHIAASICSLVAFMILIINTSIEGITLQMLLQYLFVAIAAIAILGFTLLGLSELWKLGKKKNSPFFLPIFLLMVLIVIFLGIFLFMFFKVMVMGLWDMIFDLFSSM